MAQLIKLQIENKKLKDQIQKYKEAYGCCPHVDDSTLKGGYRVVNTLQDRDNIPCCYRKKGMVVVVINDVEPFTEYRLLSDKCENEWQKIEESGGITSVNESEVELISDYIVDEESLTTQQELNEFLFNYIQNLTLDHNKLDNLQGGNITERYHLTKAQYDGLKDLVTVDELHQVAFTGNYYNLNNLPTLFSGNYNDLYNLPTLFSGDYNDLNNLPVLFSGDYNDLSNQPNIPAQVNLLQGTNVTITGTYPNLTINSTASGGGDTNIIESISRSGVPITPDGSKNVDIPIFSTSGAGLVPARVGAVATKYLREDGTWVTPTNTTYTAMTLSVLNTGTSTTANTISAQVLTNWLNGKISAVGFSGSYNDLTDKPTIPSTPNLTQVLTVGNTTTLGLTTTGSITSNIVNTQTINMEDGYSYIGTWNGFIEDDNGVLLLNHNGEIGLTAPVLKLKGMNFPSTAGTNGQVLTTDGTNMSWTTPSSGTTYSAGVGINITSNQISVKQATSSERGGTKIWKGTQSAYDAIPTKDADTLYFIEDLQSAEIAVYSGMVSSLAPTVGGTIIQLDNAVVPLSIWDRTYDWVLSWKDANGLHTLEDYQGSGFNTIKRIYRESSGAMRIEVLFTGTFEVTIPDNAKLTLHLSDDAPQEIKS